MHSQDHFLLTKKREKTASKVEIIVGKKEAKNGEKKLVTLSICLKLITAQKAGKKMMIDSLQYGSRVIWKFDEPNNQIFFQDFKNDIDYILIRESPN